MDVNLEPSNSSKRHQTSRIPKSKDPISRGDQSFMYQDILKANSPVGPSNCDLKYEVRPCMHNKDSVQPESLFNHQGKCVNGNKDKDDEVVKYMSNLPGYLQRLDSVNIQGNALNVGVLDWSRLESWKDKKKSSTDTVGKSTSFRRSKSTINSFSSGVYDETSGHQNKLCSSASNGHSFDTGSSSQFVKPSIQSFRGVQDFEITPKRKLDRKKMMTWTSKSLDRNFVDGMIEKDKRNFQDQECSSRRRISFSSLRNFGVAHGEGQNMKSQDNNIEEKVQGLQDSSSSSRKQGERVSGKSVLSSSMLVDREESTSLSNKTNAKRGQCNWRRKELQDSKANPDNQNCANELKNIVLPYPKNLRRISFSEIPHHPAPWTSAAEDLRGSKNPARQSKNHVTIGYVPKESQSAKIPHDVPKSSRLSARIEDETERNVKCSLKTQDNEICSDASHKFPSSIKMPETLLEFSSIEKCGQKINRCSAAEPEEKYGLTAKAESCRLDETLKILDQETAELAAKRNKNQSLTRRFSFNLPRLSQSFSSAVPQLSSSYVSLKSGLMRSDASTHFHATKDKDGHSRAKSSPFRRLLDPLLRSKGTDHSRSKESGQPWDGNFDSKIVQGRLPKLKDKDLELQATLRLTIKNGIPLYKFLIDNDSNIFAATMKNFSVPGKDDSGQNYTFYSINEIKRRSGIWLAQGSKGKSTRYAYNVVGQMKISSYSTSDSVGLETSKDYIVTESIMLNVDQRQAGQELMERFPDKELAAVIVKIPTDIKTHGAPLTIEDKYSPKKSQTDCFLGEEYLLNLGGTEVSNNITVVLPGGIHSLPFKGEPSPLISRWKSGGSCDCGGWDIGCRLHVLTNEKKCSTDQGISKNSSISNHLELFDQVRGPHERPIFSLAPIDNGIYSVSFNTSISLLQAFFISVAITSNQQLFRVTDFSKLAEAILQEPTLGGIHREKTTTLDSAQGLGKYVRPPYFPLERV